MDRKALPSDAQQGFPAGTLLALAGPQLLQRLHDAGGQRPMLAVHPLRDGARPPEALPGQGELGSEPPHNGRVLLTVRQLPEPRELGVQLLDPPLSLAQALLQGGRLTRGLRTLPLGALDGGREGGQGPLRREPVVPRPLHGRRSLVPLRGQPALLVLPGFQARLHKGDAPLQLPDALLRLRHLTVAADRARTLPHASTADRPRRSEDLPLQRHDGEPGPVLDQPAPQGIALDHQKVAQQVAQRGLPGRARDDQLSGPPHDPAHGEPEPEVRGPRTTTLQGQVGHAPRTALLQELDALLGLIEAGDQQPVLAPAEVGLQRGRDVRRTGEGLGHDLGPRVHAVQARGREQKAHGLRVERGLRVLLQGVELRLLPRPLAPQLLQHGRVLLAGRVGRRVRFGKRPMPLLPMGELRFPGPSF